MQQVREVPSFSATQVIFRAQCTGGKQSVWIQERCTVKCADIGVRRLAVLEKELHKTLDVLLEDERLRTT